MRTRLRTSACNPVLWALVAFASPAPAQTVDQLIPHNVKLESVDYRGKRAVKMRGFIGIAFCLQNGQFEYIYLRPTNGRADDQVRRNHSTQYSAYPNLSFAVARQQAPEKYES